MQYQAKNAARRTARAILEALDSEVIQEIRRELEAQRVQALRVARKAQQDEKIEGR